MPNPCAVEGCVVPRASRGLCMAHYARFKAKGHPFPENGQTLTAATLPPWALVPVKPRVDGPRKKPAVPAADPKAPVTIASVWSALEPRMRKMVEEEVVRRLLAKSVPAVVRGPAVRQPSSVDVMMEAVRRLFIVRMETDRGTVTTAFRDAMEDLERAAGAAGAFSGEMKDRGVGSRGGDLQSLHRPSRREPVSA